MKVKTANIDTYTLYFCDLRTLLKKCKNSFNFEGYLLRFPFRLRRDKRVEEAKTLSKGKLDIKHTDKMGNFALYWASGIDDQVALEII